MQMKAKVKREELYATSLHTHSSDQASKIMTFGEDLGNCILPQNTAYEMAL